MNSHLRDIPDILKLLTIKKCPSLPLRGWDLKKIINSVSQRLGSVTGKKKLMSTLGHRASSSVTGVLIMGPLAPGHQGWLADHRMDF